MHILLAWELGGNYGHIATLLGVANHLRQKGHQVRFVVKNSSRAGQLLDDGKFCYVPAPRPAIRHKRSSRPVSFADILAGAGFGSCEVLEGLVRSWLGIFNTMQADVLVAQYAPVAQFSARLSGLPCLSLGTGFECPPETSPFPCFRPHLRLTRTQLLAREEQILQQINRISCGKSHSSCQSLQEVLASDINLLTTLPELDHYPQRRKRCYIGPLPIINYGTSLHWREGKAVRIFLYLRPFAGIELILKILAASGADVIAHIPGIDRKMSALLSKTSVRIASSMIRLSPLLADMDVAITHSGHGTAAAALLAGVPMLMMPMTIEQSMMSRTIDRLGVGIELKRERLGSSFLSVLERLLTDPSVKKKVKSFAAKYAGYDQQRVIARIVNTIERLPAWKDTYLAAK